MHSYCSVIANKYPPAILWSISLCNGKVFETLKLRLKNWLLSLHRMITQGLLMIPSVRFKHLSCWVLHHCHSHCQEEAVVHHSSLQSYWSYPTMNNDMHIFGIYSLALLSITLSNMSNKTLIILTFGKLNDKLKGPLQKWFLWKKFDNIDKSCILTYQYWKSLWMQFVVSLIGLLILLRYTITNLPQVHKNILDCNQFELQSYNYLNLVVNHDENYYEMVI